jgi:hypothetical protein
MLMMKYWVIQDTNSKCYAAKNNNEIMLAKDINNKNVLKFYWFGIMRFIMLKQLQKKYPEYKWALKKFIPMQVTLHAVQKTIEKE